jgi:predicted secreted protein
MQIIKPYFLQFIIRYILPVTRDRVRVHIIGCDYRRVCGIVRKRESDGDR